MARRTFDIDPARAALYARVARAYGDRQDITSRVNWKALVALATASEPVRLEFEERIVRGERIGAADITPRMSALSPARPCNCCSPSSGFESQSSCDEQRDQKEQRPHAEGDDAAEAERGRKEEQALIDGRSAVERAGAQYANDAGGDHRQRNELNAHEKPTSR
jgi:hypothetical protein